MSRKWCQFIVGPVLVVVSLYIHWLSRFDDDFYFVCFYIWFYLAAVFFYIFDGYFYFLTLRVFIRVDFGIGGVALLSADLAKRFWILSFVLCGSGGGIDMITNTVLAQSFLTFILRVGVCVIVSLIFTRVLAHGFCRAR